MFTESSVLPPFEAQYEDNEPVVARPAELAVQCVVYVGDILTNRQKKSPNYRLGGKLFPFPDFYTVPNGITPKCAITRLQKRYRSVHKNHIPEDQYGLWTPSYTLRNQWDPVQGRFVDIEVGVSGASKDLLFKPISPINELGRIAGQQNGVIALDAECGLNSANDIKEAQYHYFPNWLDILRGEAKTPERLRELQDHINDRRAAAQSSELRAVGDAYLQACVDFYDWGKAYVDFQTQVINETKEVPGGARYDEIAERLFGVLELTRQDSLVKDLVKQQNDRDQGDSEIKTAIGMMAKILAKQEAAEQSLPPVEAQAPAPVTRAEAAAEFDRATEEDTFTDMSAVSVADDVDNSVLIPADSVPPEMAAEVDGFIATADEEKDDE